MAVPIEFDRGGWRVDGDREAVEFEGHIRWDNGKEYNKLCLYLFRNGKIQSMTEYCDLLYAWPALSLQKNSNSAETIDSAVVTTPLLKPANPDRETFLHGV